MLSFLYVQCGPEVLIYNKIHLVKLNGSICLLLVKRILLRYNKGPKLMFTGFRFFILAGCQAPVTAGFRQNCDKNRGGNSKKY